MFEFTVNIGKSSSFMAELWGLREGLRLAKERGFHNVEVKIDAEAVVKAITTDNGDDQCDNTLICECRELLGSGIFTIFSHTLKEGNKCADWLANLGHTNEWGTVVYDCPPRVMEDLLQLDVAGAVTRRTRS